ncbi:hypothetical protein CYMTET_6506 [Cymbomonas tetramitiformis]|uniref:Mitochondrial carrier protein n=1 Tax=Cymbomonas tetramitiformis TaxID=36881 RepID=A0AAE0GXE9_9CHLO|nr:hypothetical protein CYMTET_6506 [Cymbomonas tetramitiformis]
MSGANGKAEAKGSIVGGGSAMREFMTAQACGVAYGASYTLVSHPFDTIKTKMQAQAGFSSGGTMSAIRTVMAKEGFGGLWKGLWPPMVGSILSRSVCFSAYAGPYAAMKGTPMEQEIPGTGGLQWRVLAGGLTSALARTVFETPLELIKVRKQTGQTFRWNELFKGSATTFLRTWGLMGSFFVMLDYSARYIPEVINAPLAGPFFKGGVIATAAWWLCWPFETIKSQVQAAQSVKGQADVGWMKLARDIIHEKGIVGLYRGIAPGTYRSLLGNGVGMLIFTKLQEELNKI